MRRLLPLLALLALALPASAAAGVKRAETILPPGQSGFVSHAGLADGTGSPHLTDQTDPFVAFKRKPATFGQPGRTEQPRPDVTIVRDGFGVPAITGASTDAMWWGAGYAVAQDRLFQLELFRRATTGRLAEILGEEYLDDDLIARRDFYTRDERASMYAALPADLQARTRAYRDGVNAWIDHVRRTPSDMPGEFTALGVVPTDWSEDDTAAVGIYLARTVPSGSGVELENLRSLRAIGPSAFNRVLPLRTPGRRPTVPRRHGRFPSQPGRTVKHERRALRRTVRVQGAWDLPTPEATASARAHVADGLVGRVGGSSMFAIRRKSDRHAFLFNGPQLGYSIPELFVELELHGPGTNIRGVTAAGVPLVAIGHNGRVAWGYTSGLSDEDDLYAEELVGGPGSERYRFRGQELQMECRNETFSYRSPPTAALDPLELIASPPGAGERIERICRTIHGPVEMRAGDDAYARRYAVWNQELSTFVGLAKLGAAQSIRDVDAAMQEVTWNENVMAADDQGNIGYWHPGLHPRRPFLWDERLPYPGGGQAEWKGFLDRRKTPHVINPKQGWLANWNNVPSAGWTAGDAEASERNSGRWHRASYLMEIMEATVKRPSWETAETAIFRAGTVAQQRALANRQLRQARRRAGGRAAAIFDALLRWNGSYHEQAADGTVDPGVAIWEQFKDEVERRALSALMPDPSAAAHLAGKTGKSHEFDITSGEAFGLRMLGPRGWRRAARSTFDQLAARFKTPEPQRWREPRRMYEVTAQGAASAPDLPFFDRGTWEQLVELGP